MAYIPPNPNGQTTMASSTPVTIASDQTSVKTRLSAPQSDVTGNITTSSTSITATDLIGVGAATIQISGTYAGVAVIFEASLDNTIWTPIKAQQVNSPNMPSTTATLATNASITFNVSPLLGQYQFRVRSTAFTSGSAAVRISLSAQFVSYSTEASISDGTNTASVVANDTGYNGIPANNAMKVIPFTTSATGVQTLLANTDVRGYSAIAVVLTSAGTSLAWSGVWSPNSGGTYLASSTWAASNSVSNNAASLGVSTSIWYEMPVRLPYFQLAITAMSAGTTSGYVVLSTTPRQQVTMGVAATQGGTWQVNSFASGNAQSNGPLLTYFNAAQSNTASTVITGIHRFHKVSVHNPNATAAYLQIYDALIGSVTVGTTTPKMSLAIPAGLVNSETWFVPADYGTGIVIAATTTATGSTALAIALVVNINYI